MEGRRRRKTPRRLGEGLWRVGEELEGCRRTREGVGSGGKADKMEGKRRTMSGKVWF